MTEWTPSVHSSDISQIIDEPSAWQTVAPGHLLEATARPHGRLLLCLPGARVHLSDGSEWQIGAMRGLWVPDAGVVRRIARVARDAQAQGMPGIEEARRMARDLPASSAATSILLDTSDFSLLLDRFRAEKVSSVLWSAPTERPRVRGLCPAALCPDARRSLSVAEHLDRCWQRSPTLSELEYLFARSRFGLLRAFRDTLGIPPLRYLLHLRVRNALLQAARGRARLVDVAMSCGFSSHAHLSAACRDAFGKSPSALLGRIAGHRHQPFKGLARSAWTTQRANTVSNEHTAAVRNSKSGETG